MNHLILHTSGSTSIPKEIAHPWKNINKCIQRSVTEIGLTSKDVVLDVFPGNVIAHYTVTAMPAKTVGATLITSNFDSFTYLKLFNKFRPTFISLIPKHYEILKLTKMWKNIDMSCVRYMVTGSDSVSQEMINDFKSRGVQLVANWYGMTEMPPPVFVGYDSASFDFKPKDGFNVEFSDEGECIINGFYTGDIFDLKTKTFQKRKTNVTNKNTWKT
jgi:long-subunit acyl-CoA synthetase (AMP-forming)